MRKSQVGKEMRLLGIFKKIGMCQIVLSWGELSLPSVAFLLMCLWGTSSQRAIGILRWISRFCFVVGSRILDSLVRAFLFCDRLRIWVQPVIFLQPEDREASLLPPVTSFDFSASPELVWRTQKAQRPNLLFCIPAVSLSSQLQLDSFFNKSFNLPSDFDPWFL